jgi:hypothetical protein
MAESRPAGVLYLGHDVTLPPELVEAGFRFLERGWDVAAPFAPGHVLAADVGTEEERERTRALVGDLRVPLYSLDIMFVGEGARGGAFICALARETFIPDLLDEFYPELLDENVTGVDERLAFLRAVFQTKPRLCVLPRLWLGTAAERNEIDRLVLAAIRQPAPTVPRQQPLSRRALARRRSR